MSHDKYQKLFVKNNSILSKLALEINNIEERHKLSEIESIKIEKANKELLTSLSHDVRTPLTSLLGYLDALNDNILNEDEKIHYINTSRKKAYDLKKLVDTLFDWFKIDSNEMKLNSKPNDICELIRENIIEWLPIFEKNSINYNLDVPEYEIYALIDQEAFIRVLNNIIQNSVEHSSCKNIAVSLETTDSIALKISDDGIGIDKTVLNNIFDRLYKADSSRTKQSSGLGLYIAKQLTEMMGGNICAESSQNQGFNIKIELPFYKND
ncbi:MAG: sensor histidine kinase [Proteocatella sp.]